MRITLEKGYCLKEKNGKRFLTDGEEFTEMPQIYPSRPHATQVKNISSIGDSVKVKGVEKVLVVEE